MKLVPSAELIFFIHFWNAHATPDFSRMRLPMGELKFICGLPPCKKHRWEIENWSPVRALKNN
jgi:hypothetical protein